VSRQNKNATTTKMINPTLLLSLFLALSLSLVAGSDPQPAQHAHSDPPASPPTLQDVTDAVLNAVPRNPLNPYPRPHGPASGRRRRRVSFRDHFDAGTHVPSSLHDTNSKTYLDFISTVLKDTLSFPFPTQPSRKIHRSARRQPVHQPRRLHYPS